MIFESGFTSDARRLEQNEMSIRMLVGFGMGLDESLFGFMLISLVAPANLRARAKLGLSKC